jgi:hypothetical protein
MVYRDRWTWLVIDLVALNEVFVNFLCRLEAIGEGSAKGPPVLLQRR